MPRMPIADLALFLVPMLSTGQDVARRLVLAQDGPLPGVTQEFRVGEAARGHPGGARISNLGKTGTSAISVKGTVPSLSSVAVFFLFGFQEDSGETRGKTRRFRRSKLALP